MVLSYINIEKRFKIFCIIEQAVVQYNITFLSSDDSLRLIPWHGGTPDGPDHTYGVDYTMIDPHEIKFNFHTWLLKILVHTSGRQRLPQFWHSRKRR